MVKGFSKYQEHNTGRLGNINPIYVEMPLGLHDASGKTAPYFMCADGCMRPREKMYKAKMPDPEAEDE
jgi:hypothetical protein